MRYRIGAAAAALLLVALSGPGAAGQLYDMTPMLFAPHPFEVQPARPRQQPSRPGYAGRLYDMTPLLFAPHPFDVQAQARRDGREALPDSGAPTRPN